MSKACRVDRLKEMVGWEVGGGGLVDSFAHAVWFQWGQDSPVLLQAASLLFQSFYFLFLWSSAPARRLMKSVWVEGKKELW